PWQGALRFGQRDARRRGEFHRQYRRLHRRRAESRHEGEAVLASARRWHAPFYVSAGQGREMTSAQDARGPQAVARFLRPKSVAIVGISARPGSAGQVILQSLKLNKFQGDIHLVGRSEEPIDGRKVLKSAAELPDGVDLAVFTLPAAAVRDGVAECVKAKV